MRIRTSSLLSCVLLLTTLTVGVVSAQDEVPGGLYTTTNPAELINDSVVALEGDLSAAGTALSGFADIANVQSVWFDSSGTAYMTVDVTADSGAIYIYEDLAGSDSIDLTTPTRTIGGFEAAGLQAPKGIQVIEELDLILVANNGPANVKGWSLDASGDVLPSVLLQPSSVYGGSVWDIYYDAASDTLFVAGTTGAVFAYDAFSTDLGVAGISRTIIPTSSGRKISVNLHGIYYYAPSDTLILSDVGAADNNADGQIFVIPAASRDGNLGVSARILGDQTMLGNPVDIAFDGANLIVAEKANDAILVFNNILGVYAGRNIAADTVLEVVKPESLAYAGGM